MLFSRALIETVADYLAAQPVPLVVDPVMVASSGAQLLEDDAVEALVARLFPLATVVTPNLLEARALAGARGLARASWPRRSHELGAPAVVVTGGHGEPPVDHLFDGTRHVEIPVERHAVARHARRRLHPLGHARGAARPRPAARGGGARCGARCLRARCGTGSPGSARATGRSTSST